MLATEEDAPAGPAEASTKPSFRADIDGLRALAVGIIVAYHVGLPGFSGGFVGVDVFFVISGYLITRNLVAERADTGRVALWAFWGRRMRRLAPALGLMVLGTLAASYLILWPLRLQAVAKGGATSSLYISNIYFAAEAKDYFADDRTSPFLHTWSLSVEEQFYVVWPLLVAATMAIGARFLAARRQVLAVMMGVAAAGSFALSVVLTNAGTPWAFFGLPTRVWQFALAGLAATVLRGPLRSPVARTVLGWAGIGLIAASVVTFDELTSYPGLAAAVPTAGALAAIASGGGSRRAVLDPALAAKPSQAIGRLSYSWYLWHWPFIVLGVTAVERDELSVRVIAAALSLGVAAASYRWLERPVRFMPRLTRSPAWSIGVGALCATVGVLAAAALWVQTERQLDRPLDAAINRAAADIDYERRCQRDPDLPGACVVGDPDASTTVVVLGDSHAGAWIPAFATAANDRDLRIVIRSRGACPSIDVPIAAVGTRRDSAACEAFRAQSAEQVEALKPEAVILANAAYPDRVLTGPGDVGSAREQLDRWEAAVGDQVRSLEAEGTPVGLIANGPQLGYNPLDCMSKERSLQECTPTRAEAMEDSEPFRAAEARAIEPTGVVTFDGAEVLCDDRRCLISRDGQFTLRDASHMTVTFASGQGEPVGAFIDQLLATGT